MLSSTSRRFLASMASTWAEDSIPLGANVQWVPSKKLVMIRDEVVMHFAVLGCTERHVITLQRNQDAWP